MHIVLEVVTGQRGKNFENLIAKKEIVTCANGNKEYESWACCPKTEKSQNQSQFAVSQWEQFKILFHRALLIMSRDNVSNIFKLTKLLLTILKSF